jgi:hypothetical protein
MYRVPTGCGEREKGKIRTLKIEGCGTRLEEKPEEGFLTPKRRGIRNDG